MVPIQRVKETKAQFYIPNIEENLQYSSKELTALYRIWLNTAKNSQYISIPSTVDNNILNILQSKKILSKNNNKFQLTSDGQKLIKKIILTTEKSAFEKKGIDVVDAMTILASKPKRSSNLSITKKAFNLKKYKEG